jgi:BON domain
MKQGNSFLKSSIRTGLTAGMLSVCVAGFGQAKPSTMPDAQIEANVLKALASAPQLAEQAITTTTVYGVVTLSGTVQDEPSRDTAEHLAANAAGVQKVVDQLTIGPIPAAGSNAADGANGTNPMLQSDGTMAPAQGQNPSNAPYGGAYPQGGQYPPAGQYPPQGGQYPQQGGQYPQPYGQPPSAYSQQPQRPFVAQKGGDAVVVPNGSILRVRINQGMDSKHTAPGTVFDALVLNDVVAGGSIAIPRGATAKGVVVEAHKAGDFAGKGELKLQLTQIELGGKVYPVVTDFWWHQGADKTSNTVGNTVGLGAVGALIGAVAGGGVGAAVGAGVGGVAGLGVSSASHKGEAALPSEAVVTFHLTQPTDVTTVSQAELNRLSSGVPVAAQPQFQRRYYPPPPPPGYYGPAYYPPPY